MSTESNDPEVNSNRGSEPSAGMGDHSDKYNDPRAQISRRGILIGVAVVCLGIMGAALSIWARKTQLDQTRAFWGDDVITALQLAEEVELLRPPKEPESEAPLPVRLSGMPGLGHLRHTLLDDRSYDWATVRESVANSGAAEEQMVVRLTDPTAKRFPETKLTIHLDSGWVMVNGTDQQVQLNDRFRNALPAYLKRVANYEPLRSEVRAKKAEDEN